MVEGGNMSVRLTRPDESWEGEYAMSITNSSLRGLQRLMPDTAGADEAEAYCMAGPVVSILLPSF